MSAITWTKVIAGHYVSSAGDNVRKIGNAWHWVSTRGQSIETFRTLGLAQAHIQTAQDEVYGPGDVDPILTPAPAEIGPEKRSQGPLNVPTGPRPGRKSHRNPNRRAQRKSQRAARRHNRTR